MTITWTILLTIIIAIFLLIFLLTAGICLYAYRMAFQAPKRLTDPEYHMPEGSQYEVHIPQMQQSIDEMLAVPYEEISITSYDGLKLCARYYHIKEKAPLHIQFHGYKGSPFVDFCGGSKFARQLDHNVLVVYQRSHGISEGRTITFGIKERRDCLSWIHYAAKRFGMDTPVFLWGISMGAATVLMVNDLKVPGNVRGILADCPYSSPKAIIKKVCQDVFHFSPNLMYPFIRLSALLFGHFDLEESSAVAAVQQAQIPILLAHGEDDRFVPWEMSREIYEANPDKITFLSIPDAGHGLAFLTDPETYAKAATDFIENVLQS